MYKQPGKTITNSNGTKTYEPVQIYPVYLTEQECSQLIAVYEKQGILGSIVDKARASAKIKKIK